MNTSNNRAKLRDLRQQARIQSLTEQQRREASGVAYVIFGKHNQSYEDFLKSYGV